MSTPTPRPLTETEKTIGELLWCAFVATCIVWFCRTFQIYDTVKRIEKRLQQLSIQEIASANAV